METKTQSNTSCSPEANPDLNIKPEDDEFDLLSQTPVQVADRLRALQDKAATDPDSLTADECREALTILHAIHNHPTVSPTTAHRRKVTKEKEAKPKLTLDDI